MSLYQCPHTVEVRLTDLTYCCLLDVGHAGPHAIGISSDFNLEDATHDVTGLFGVSPRTTSHER